MVIYERKVNFAFEIITNNIHMVRLRLILTMAAAATMTAAYCAKDDRIPVEFPRDMKPTSHREVRDVSLEEARASEAAIPAVMKKSLKKEAAAPGIITELPADAKYLDYDRDGVGYYYMYGTVYSEFLVARQSEIYISGNDVYLKNPVIDLPTDTYIKGTVTEAGMTFQLPQPITAYEWDGTWYYTYASVMNLIDTETGGLSYVQPEDEADNVLVFKAVEGEEGKYVMDGMTDGKRILGTSDDYGYWTGYGEYAIVYTPFDTPLVTPPAGIELSQYIMPYKIGSARMMHFGFDGNDCYIQGLSAFAPEGWVKGTVQDGRITIPSGQYVGINYDWDMRSRLYFHAAEMGEEWVDWAQAYYPAPYGVDEMTFGYNAESQTYHSPLTVGFTTGNAPDAKFYEYFSEPTLRYQPEVISLVPATPIFKDYYPMQSSEGQCLHFTIPDLNVDGYLLDNTNLYYRVWINGEPYVWERSEYPTIYEETMEWMPVAFDDWWDFMTHEVDNYISIVVYVLGMDTFGVQSSYLDGTDRYESGIMTFSVDNPTEAEMTLRHGDVRGIRFTDLTGKPVADPANGIFVKTVVFEDGSVITSKIVK